jgi:hypothetical protein
MSITPQDLENGGDRIVEEITDICITDLQEKLKDKKFCLLTSINTAIAGYIFKGGDIKDIPEILYNFSEDYLEAIKEEESPK